MFNRRRDFLRLRVAISDVLVILVAFILAYVVRQQLPVFREFYLRPGPMAAMVTASIGVWLLVGAGTGFYRSLGGDFGSRAVLLVRQSFLSAASLTAVMYLFKLADVSRLFLLLFVTISFFLLLAWRAAAPATLRMPGESSKPHYVIVGSGEEADELARLIASDDAHPGNIVALLRLEDPEAGPAVRQIFREHVVDEVIFAAGHERVPRCQELFHVCQEEGVRLRVLVSFFGGIASTVSLDQLYNMPLLTFSAAPDNDYLLFVKRLFDIAVGSCMALVFLPPSLLVALAVRLTSPGPIFFVQERCGLNGRCFRLYKFRSMYQDAAARRAEVEKLNQLDGPVFKCANDPRITPVGRFIRRFSIDEWPQLINVIRGDMSLVGPRPPLPDEVRQYTSWQRRRLRMRPGLTCLWVLEGHNRLDFLNWMRLDLHYIDNWTLGLDFRILLQSIPHVLSGKGM